MTTLLNYFIIVSLTLIRQPHLQILEKSYYTPCLRVAEIVLFLFLFFLMQRDALRGETSKCMDSCIITFHYLGSSSGLLHWLCTSLFLILEITVSSRMRHSREKSCISFTLSPQ